MENHLLDSHGSEFPKPADNLIGKMFGGFVGLPLLIYASGFLVLRFYYTSYALRGIEPDLFSPRTFYVGFICIAFTSIFAVSAACLFDYHRFKHNPHSSHSTTANESKQTPESTTHQDSDSNSSQQPLKRFNTSAVMTVLVLCLDFYLPLLFGSKLDNWQIIILFFLLAAIVALGIAAPLLRKNEKHEKLSRLVQLLFMVESVALVVLCAPFAISLGKAAWPGGVFFVLFASAFGLLVILTTDHDDEVGVREQKYRRIFSIIILALVYYLILASFSLVFQYIPSYKGGGDIARAPFVKLYLNTMRGGKDPNVSDLIWQLNEKELVLIESTASHLYFAEIPNVENESALRDFEKESELYSKLATWRGRGDKPAVFEVPRAEIRSMVYSPIHSRPKLKLLWPRE